ncbi:MULTISPECIES: TetR/AcrR family transcriptional regulator [unclassified Novosphingobium]|uniref:TetR/AcrR family transcriptional regulator n=1 Tax=unclassified Novosphingobium TaxID=2644732 RepID=UPI0013596EAD|nr:MULTISPECIES: TetR/AcrR family transcriptional regulator [unclassified Novosphingobium]
MTNNCTIDRPRAARSAARRQHLLLIARNLFAEKGFHQTGVAQIANASGIAVGQIYRDFANKEAIIAAICEADLAGWLQEEVLEAAVAARDSQAIRDWIERVAIEEPTKEERRLMCDLLAEVGRNPIIAEINRKVNERLNTSLEAALVSLAPDTTQQQRRTMMDFILSISWGMVARMELFPYREHATLHRYVGSLLRQEIAALGR